jgi:hypothetical protein
MFGASLSPAKKVSFSYYVKLGAAGKIIYSLALVLAVNVTPRYIVYLALRNSTALI